MRSVRTVPESGKGLFLSDPRSCYLLALGAIACEFEPDTIDDREMIYALADADSARALTKIDEVLNNAASCVRLVPPTVIGVERIRAASLWCLVWRNLLPLYYSWAEGSRAAGARAADVAAGR